MKRKIKTNKIIIAEETELGKGVTIKLEKTSPPIIKLLRMNYKKDPNCITGDIDFLFSFDGVGIDDGENHWPGT